MNPNFLIILKAKQLMKKGGGRGSLHPRSKNYTPNARDACSRRQAISSRKNRERKIKTCRRSTREPFSSFSF